MASTNKTTHYELSQYVGTDKPTYLTDYNNDMSAIDTGIYNAQTKADSGYSLANTADGKADQALINAGSAQTDASTALTRIGTLANLTTTEKTSVVGAINEVNTLAGTAESNVEKLNLTSFTTTYGSNMTASVGSVGQYSAITVATNSDGSIGKIYGTIYVTTSSESAMTVTITGTALRPTSNITINNAGLTFYGTSGLIGESVEIQTNGTLVFTLYNVANTTQRHTFVPCLYFMKDFGDTPQP